MSYAYIIHGVYKAANITWEASPCNWAIWRGSLRWLPRGIQLPVAAWHCAFRQSWRRRTKRTLWDHRTDSKSPRRPRSQRLATHRCALFWSAEARTSTTCLPLQPRHAADMDLTSKLVHAPSPDKHVPLKRWLSIFWRLPQTGKSWFSCCSFNMFICFHFEHTHMFTCQSIDLPIDHIYLSYLSIISNYRSYLYVSVYLSNELSIYRLIYI